MQWLFEPCSRFSDKYNMSNQIMCRLIRRFLKVPDLPIMSQNPPISFLSQSNCQAFKKQNVKI